MIFERFHNKIVLENSSRNSSVECFRMLSMFLVLVVHLNGIFAGLDPHELNFYNQGQIIIEAIAVICVNCFLIISGYYGLKFKWKSLWDLYLIVVSIRLPFFLIRCVYNKAFDFEELVFALTPLTSENFFINAYFLLLILSPVLNSFINSKGKDIWKFAIALYFIEFWFDCIRHNAVVGFSEGYTVLHFIVVYFLARALYLNKDALQRISNDLLIIIWVLSTGINILLMNMHIQWSLYYTNPFVLLSAFSLFILFSRKVFHNPYINWIAKSSFAVYVVHLTSPVVTPFISLDRHFLNSYPYFEYVLLMLAMAVGVFVFSLAYDKCRLALTEKLTDKLFLTIEGYFNKKHGKESRR